MYKRLTRWLRLLGYDASFDTSLEDEEYPPIAIKEDRILLTRDDLLAEIAIKQGAKTIVIKGLSIEEKLVHLHKESGIELSFSDDILPRCSNCNGELKIITKKKVAELVPEGTREHFDLFWQCKNKKCAKVYWKGSHWQKMEDTLKNCQELLKKEKKQSTKKLLVRCTRNDSRR